MKIANKTIGCGNPCYVIAEIGINHNGDLDIAERLIHAAADAGCDAVKFQKRTVEAVYSPEELERPRESPFGNTNGELKRGLEFDERQYEVIAEICACRDIHWLASCWDVGSVDFISQFDPPAYKIASASLTDQALLLHTVRQCRPLLVSTGMSTLEEIDAAVAFLRRYTEAILLMHCVSTYPARNEHLNLACIPMLAERYGLPVGYSGHELGLATTVAAVAMGACVVERHITLDRSMYGSDQAASVEPQGLRQLVRDIRAVESAMGDGKKRLLDEEQPIKAKLRRI